MSATEELKCDKCDRTFDTQQGLFTHKQWVHSSPEQLARRMAGAKAAAATRTKDTNINTGLQYKCQVCGESYQSGSGLRYHAKTRHGGMGLGNPEVEGMSKCKDCEYVGNPFGMSLHRSLKHGERGKWGLIREKYQRSEERTPKRIPKNEKNLGCPYCQFTTGLKSGLTRHMRQQHPGQSGTFRITRRGPYKKRETAEIEVKPTTTMSEKILAIVADRIYARIMEEMK